MTAAAELIQLLRRELHDTGDEPDRRYSDTQLLDYLNHAATDIVQRAPEANIVRELHTIPANDPALQTLASDRATKFIKVEANKDSRFDSPTSIAPNFEEGDYVLKQPETLGPPTWYDDYAIVSFNKTVGELFRGVTTRAGLTYPDVPMPDSWPAPAPYQAYNIPNRFTVFAECEMRLRYDPAPATSVNVVAGMQFSQDPANFNHNETSEPLVYWSNREPGGTFKLFGLDAIDISGYRGAFGSAAFDPQSADDTQYEYPYGCELDNNWRWQGLGAFSFGPDIFGIEAWPGKYTIANPPVPAVADSRIRILLSANFSTLNAIEIRNIRFRCPELEQYALGGVGLDLGYVRPRLQPGDDSPTTSTPSFCAPTYRDQPADGYDGIMVFANYEPGKKFPDGPGGSSSYTGIGFGSGAQGIQWNDSFSPYQWPWDVPNLGGVPPGEWEGNLVYWPSDKGINLAEQGWDGSIDNLEVSFSHIMIADPQNVGSPNLAMRYAIALEYSEDGGDTWQLDVWMESFGSRSLALAETPAFDSRLWAANFRPNATNIRLRIEPYMNWPANSDSTPANDVMLYNFNAFSSDWVARYTPLPPLDPPIVGDADSETNGATANPRWFEKDAVDTYDPDWEYNPPAVADNQDSLLISYYDGYSHDPRDPTRFYLYPAPPSEETKIFVHYSRIPNEMSSIYDDFPLNEKWEGAAVKYAKYMALSGQGRDQQAPEASRRRLLNEYTTSVQLARDGGYSDSMRDDG